MDSSTKMYKYSCILYVLLLFVVFIILSIIIIVVVVVEMRIYIYILSLQVVLTSTCPFQLDDKTFKLLTDIFLFYDLSVFGFIQHYKVSILVLNVCGGPFSIIKVVN
jgi:hypothetical protein